LRLLLCNSLLDRISLSYLKYFHHQEIYGNIPFGLCVNLHL
jgi:hypothetical protein